jgi:hypothetical protein
MPESSQAATILELSAGPTAVVANSNHLDDPIRADERSRLLPLTGSLDQPQTSAGPESSMMCKRVKTLLLWRM